MSLSCDLAVVGSGPGGYAAAVAASRRGLRVAVIERGAWGGVCLNVGCIPTKALVAVAHTLRRIQHAAALGIQVDGVRVNFSETMARNERIVGGLRTGLLGLLKHHHVELIGGDASLEEAHRLRIAREGGADTLTADRIIFATGASPSSGPWTFDGQRLLSYRDLLGLTAIPTSLLIIGGGVIGCEFASCFAQFGTAVTIVEQQAQLLPAEDPEAVRLFTRLLQGRGVKIFTRSTVASLDASSSGVRATVSGQAIEAARCLIAIGQRPNSRGLGLEQLGIDVEPGIRVNEHLLTSQPHIAAIGDCVPNHGLAHVATAEGLAAVHNLYETDRVAVDLQRVPRCIFTDPEIAHVGLTEPQVEGGYRVSRFSFGALGKSVCDEEPDGFVKMLVAAGTDRILGVTIIGAHASSLIHAAVLAIHHGLTARQLAGTMTAHPTLAEGVTEAAAQIYGEGLCSAVGPRARS